MDASKPTASRGQNSSVAQTDKQQLRQSIGESLLQDAGDDLHQAARADDPEDRREHVDHAEAQAEIALELLEGSA